MLNMLKFRNINTRITSFYTPWKRQKTAGFLMFSRGIERSRSGVFIVNFEHISHLFLLFLLLASRQFSNSITPLKTSQNQLFSEVSRRGEGVEMQHLHEMGSRVKHLPNVWITKSDNDKNPSRNVNLKT